MSFVGDTLTIFRREMLVFKSNIKTNIIRSIIFPIVIIFFFGNINASTFNTNIAVVNYANNPASFAFINDLQHGQELSVVNVTTQQNALTLLHNSKVSAVVVILPTFPTKSAASASDVDVYYSESNFAAVPAALSTISSVSSSFAVSTATFNEASNMPSKPVDNGLSEVLLYGANTNYKTFLTAGIIAMVAAFGSLFGGGISLITDRQLGNLKSFLLSPISKNSVILGKILSGTVQSVLYGVLALMVGLIAGAGVAMGIVGLLWIILIVVMISLGFSGVTIILASRMSQIQTYSILGNMIVLPMWFLSGAFFPASSLPAFMQPFSTFNPMTYAVSGMRDVMLVGYFPVGSILLDMGVLVAFLAFGVLASFKMFKPNIS